MIPFLERYSLPFLPTTWTFGRLFELAFKGPSRMLALFVASGTLEIHGQWSTDLVENLVPTIFRAFAGPAKEPQLVASNFSNGQLHRNFLLNSIGAPLDHDRLKRLTKTLSDCK